MTVLVVFVAAVLALLVTAHGWLKVSFFVVPALAGGLVAGVLTATVVGVQS